MVPSRPLKKSSKRWDMGMRIALTTSVGVSGTCPGRLRFSWPSGPWTASLARRLWVCVAASEPLRIVLTSHGTHLKKSCKRWIGICGLLSRRYQIFTTREIHPPLLAAAAASSSSSSSSSYSKLQPTVKQQHCGRRFSHLAGKTQAKTMAEQWIIDLNKELEAPPPPTEHEFFAKSIYRVPKILTDVNYQAYEPKLASFGPFHHDCRHLRPMEQHKHRALVHFLRRIHKSSKTPEDLVVVMKKVEHLLLGSYDSIGMEEDDDECRDKERGQRRREWIKEKDEFLKLMIVDGCFALEIMLADKRSRAGEDKGDYSAHDPVFGDERKNYVAPDLKRDMLLLENQIPLLALETLAAIDGSGMGDVSELIKEFYNIGSNASPEDTDRMTDGGLKPAKRYLHILDLYRKVMIAEGEYGPSYEDNVQSATELRDAGVSFCQSGSNSFKDISFSGGVLSLPPLEIDDTTESLLLNLMAFERLHATAGNEITAYAFFMDGLINTADDVELLRKEKIIEGWVGCDGNIANLFNRITKEATLVVFKEDINVDVNLKLNCYCKRRTHKWRASFMQTYLKNPWVFTSLLGGLLLLALTVLQTVYTIMGYYKT
ncbi:UPF0481 protein [Apostasia shenzhenica]|uniref:UPF0481 protein n=1 Tax=Apostasia shenzhenica TaxID=1088818 RepID=A0A2I0ASV4_9ASPA|nr:UPF0481 protein [Apostasia shenzhenica]